jgi:arylsulfatase A-like enzyme
MPITSAVVLVIDRLGAGWLGPYGNTWLDTPTFNRLAARSVLCETMMVAAPDLATAYRGLWSGQHALPTQIGDIATLPDAAKVAGASTILVSDESELAGQPLAEHFEERLPLRSPAPRRSAQTIEQTGLYSFFDAARTSLNSQKQPFLLWLHSQGMQGLWDAPQELRLSFADEDDPEPPDFVAPPTLLLPERFDPDELLGYVHAYAGQVTLADLCLALLLDALDDHPLANETMLVVTSPRGCPLGEHRRVGPCDEALYGELLHVPALVQLPGGEHALRRCRQVLQPTQLYSIIAQTCGWQTANAAVSSTLLEELLGATGDHRRAAYAVGPQQRAIRTPAWFLRESIVGGQVQHELFAKPDDRWEANEVSSRGGDVAELLAAELDRFQAAAAANTPSESPPLAELLCDTWR